MASDKHPFHHLIPPEVESLRPSHLHRPDSSDLAEHEPTITILQRSREYEACYQLNVIENIPQVRVVVPEKAGVFKFHIYRVQLSQRHPLCAVFQQYSRYRGSRAFDRARDAAEAQLLCALGEMMKDLFWSGLSEPTFPPEILVEQLL